MRSLSERPGVARAAAIYCALHAQGVRLERIGDGIRIEPVSAVAPALLAEVKQYKPILLRFLAWPILPPELAALLRAEWFGGNEIDLTELTEDEIRAIGLCGLAYQVKATPRRHTAAADLPAGCHAALACTRLGPCGRATCGVARSEAA